MRLRRKFTRFVLTAAILPLVAACPRDSAHAPDSVSMIPDLSCEGMANSASAKLWKAATTTDRPAAQNQFLTAEDSDAVLRHFERIGYDFETVRTSAHPVPRVYLAKMPSDMPEIEETQARKQLFLAAMLPAALQVNEEIRETRRRLAAIEACRQVGQAQAEAIEDWVAMLAQRYRTKATPSALLHKIGEIPPSLALAQAAVESGWGTSNPAQSINSLFGQYAVDRNTAGKITPRLASYDNILEAVRAYAHNLNTHRAYAGFRASRLAMMEKGEPLDSIKLAEKLISYSTRKSRYIRDVQRMIRMNGLIALDTAGLARHTERL